MSMRARGEARANYLPDLSVFLFDVLHVPERFGRLFYCKRNSTHEGKPSSQTQAVGPIQGFDRTQE